MASSSTSRTTTGNADLTGKPQTDLYDLITVSGTYGTVTFKIQGSADATNFADIACIDMTTGLIVAGGTTISPTDDTTYMYKVPCDGLVSVRVNVTAIASGTFAVSHSSYSVVAPGFNYTSNAGTTLGSTLTLSDAANIAVGTSTGAKIGTATSQKIGLWNATPIVQPANTVDYLAGLVNVGLRASGGTAAAAFPGLISSSSATGGIGYATGAGGAVSQGTDRTTGVTLNTICGAITTQATSLAGGAEVTFTVTNSACAVGDTVIASVRSGPTAGTNTFVTVTTVAAGSFNLTLNNPHASTADTGAAIINFAIIKAVGA